MKTAAELKKSLILGLLPDVSGKTTPIQRLTPFLRDLVQYLEEHEQVSSDTVTQAAPAQTTSENGLASKATG